MMVDPANPTPGLRREEDAHHDRPAAPRAAAAAGEQGLHAAHGRPTRARACASSHRIGDAVVPRGACDFVTDIAAPLPLGVICALMGVRLRDWELMFTLTNRVLGADDPEYPTVAGDARERRIRACGRCSPTPGSSSPRAARRRRDDLLSVLTGASWRAKR